MIFQNEKFLVMAAREVSDSVRRFPRVLGRFTAIPVWGLIWGCIAFLGVVMKLY